MCGFGQIIFLGQNVPRRLLHLKPKLSTRQQFAPLILYDAPLGAWYHNLHFYPGKSSDDVAALFLFTNGNICDTLKPKKPPARF
jgi:hypothetical protein